MKPEETLEEKVERLMGFLDEMQDRCKAVLEHYAKKPREFWVCTDDPEADPYIIEDVVYDQYRRNGYELIRVREIIE